MHAVTCLPATPAISANRAALICMLGCPSFVTDGRGRFLAQFGLNVFTTQ